jgi:hypothetical protein
MICRMRLVAASAFVLGILLGFAPMGCDKPDPCTQYCDKNLTCQPPVPPDTSAIPKCIQTCHDLAAKDAAYEKAIETTVSCFTSNTCDELRNGACQGAT